MEKWPVDATDSKGEPIHQTLMAKKMQRLDESPDFRPFKFRIQAFTHAFLEEVRRFPAWHGNCDYSGISVSQQWIPGRAHSNEEG